MNEEVRNIVVGFFSLAVFLLVGAFSFGGSQIETPNEILVKAVFNQIDGLKTGDEVRLAGIQIGEVGRLELGDDHSAIVTLKLDRDVKIPTDTSAAIEDQWANGLPGTVKSP